MYARGPLSLEAAARGARLVFGKQVLDGVALAAAVREWEVAFPFNLYAGKMSGKWICRGEAAAALTNKVIFTTIAVTVSPGKKGSMIDRKDKGETSGRAVHL